MLDAVRLEKLKTTLESLPCQVVLPPGQNDFFQRRGSQSWQRGDLRRFVRSQYPMRAMLEYATSLPTLSRGSEKHVVLMKDISRQGAACLHFEQLYPGEEVRLLLPMGWISYTVARCLRHGERCFEIGTVLAVSE